RLDRAAADLTDYGLTPSVRAAIVADLLNRDGTDQTPGLLVEVYNLLVRENQFPKLHDLIRETIGTVAKLVSLDRFPSDRTEPRNEAAKLREMADKLRTWQRRRVFGSDLDGGPPDVGMGFRPTADEAAHLSSNANAIASVVEAAVQRGLGVPRNALCPAVCDLASWFAQWSAEMGGTNLLADWSPAVGHALTDLSQLVELLTQHCRDESGGARFDERIPLDSIPDSIVAAMRSCAAELKAWSDAANEYIATGKVSERLPGLLVAEVRNEIEYTHEMISSNPAPLDESTTLAFTHQPASKRLKRSTERGEARRKQIAALTKHHQYADGGCLNTDPIGVNELAKLADVAPSTASVFFNTEFAGHVKYRAKCTDASTLADALKALRGEFRPAELSRMTQEAFEAGKRRSEDD
ncbi:MAG: hypothetical protein K1X74_09250, partial [Pirellulales bacterium]|nr:hypothetical protein [Pirellulales bacterium]